MRWHLPICLVLSSHSLITKHSKIWAHRGHSYANHHRCLSYREKLTFRKCSFKKSSKKRIARSRAAQTGGCHYEQVCGRAMGQKGNGTVCVPRRESQLKMAVRNGLIWTANVASWAHVMSGLCYCRRPCLGLWPHSDWGLCWCPWLMLPSKSRQMPEVWAVIWAMLLSEGHVATRSF